MRKMSLKPLAERPCGSSKCAISTGIDGSYTFGSGELSTLGYWEHPCAICELIFQQKYPKAKIETRDINYQIFTKITHFWDTF